MQQIQHQLPPLFSTRRTRGLGLTVFEQSRMIDIFHRTETAPHPIDVAALAIDVARSVRELLPSADVLVTYHLGETGILGYSGRKFAAMPADVARGAAERESFEQLLDEEAICTNHFLASFSGHPNFNREFRADQWYLRHHLTLGYKEVGHRIQPEEEAYIADVIDTYAPEYVQLEDPYLTARLSRQQPRAAVFNVREETPGFDLSLITDL